MTQNRMRRRRVHSRDAGTALLAFAIFALAAGEARSQTRWWDLNGTTAGAGSATPDGVWDTTTANWNTVTAGTNATTTWTNTGALNARFSAGTDATGSYTITVSGTINVNQIGLEDGNVTFTGGTVNFNANAAGSTATSLLTGIATGTPDVTAIFESIVSGTSGFRIARSTVIGNHIVVFKNTSNTLTGGIFLNAGQTVRLGASNVIPDANVVTFNRNTDNNFFDLNNFNETVKALATGVTGTLTPQITLGSGTLTLDAPVGEVFPGIISGTGTLVKNGSGAQILTGANTYASTIINDGTLQIGNGGTTGSLSNSGSVTNNGTLTFNRSNSSTYGGAIAGTGTVNKVGAGVLTLTGSNTYTGATSITAGMLVAAGNNALGTTASGTTVSAGGTLGFQGNVNYTAAETVSIAGSGAGGRGAIDNVSGSNTFGGAVTMTANSSIGSTDGNLTLTGTLGGEFALTKVGNGVVTLAGSNTYTGGTTISAGKLNVNSSLSGPITIGTAGTLGGTGAINTNIVGSGRVAPGNSPGILTINGDYTQNATSVLEIEVAGTTPGNNTNNHDQLIVNGAATLAGRLEVPIINGFVPQPNNNIKFITAQSLSGSFKSIVAPNLEGANPEHDLAIEVTIDTVNNEGWISFVEPIVIQLATTTETNWSDTSAWDTSTVPRTSANTTINNPAGNNDPLALQVRQVDVAQVNSLNVVGVNATMTIGLENGSTLSASTHVTVGNLGVIEVDGGSLEASRVNVNAGGTIAGGGALVGQITLGENAASQSATLSPGLAGSAVGHFDIEGPYRQLKHGTLQIDVEGTESIEFDTLEVSGQATLGGTLRVDASGFVLTSPGTPLGIISAGSLASGTEFADVVTVGNSSIFFAPIYEESVSGDGGSDGGSGSSDLILPARVSIAGYNAGDMNRNGVYDPGDVSAFALALVRPLTYRQTYKLWGDMAGGSFDELADGILDVDDIPGFREVMAGSGVSFNGFAAAVAWYQHVPEPASALLFFGGVWLLLPLRLRASGAR